MSEVDIEVSTETEHPVSDINVALIPLVLVSFALTGGYYIFSLLTAHEREPIPSFVDFLELYDWPPEHYASESVTVTTDHEFNRPLEQCSPREIGGGGLVGLEIAQESVENGSPYELVVMTHVPCYSLNNVARQQRFHNHHWSPRLRMLPAPSSTRTVATIISASEGATNPFTMLVGAEPAYLNTS